MESPTAKRVLWLGLLLASFLPFTTLSNDDQGHHQSGIIGSIHWGVFEIIYSDGVPDVVPIPERVTITSETGEVVAEMQTQAIYNDPWHFEVFLKPGRYIVAAHAPEIGNWQNQPVEVLVEKKQFSQVTVFQRPSGFGLGRKG